MFCCCSRSKVFFEAKISRGELTSFLSLSSFLSHTRPFSQQGYTAPEVVSNARSYDGRAADIWSSAVMLFVMLFCEYPFERVGDGNTGGNKFAKVLERIQKVDYRFPANIPVSTACRDLISKVLVADVSKRLTIEQIQAHPWYQVDLPPGVTSMNEQVSLFRVPLLSFREGSLLLFERKLEALAPRFTPSHAQNVQRTTPTKKIEKKSTQCLALRGQSAGLQTEEEIQSVVMAAIGKGGAAGAAAAAAKAAAAKSGSAGKGGEYDEFIDEALEEDFGDDHY